MQDGEVKGTEMPISFDVCSSAVSQFLIPQPPPGVSVTTPSPFASLLCHIKKTRRWVPSVRHSVTPLSKILATPLVFPLSLRL